MEEEFSSEYNTSIYAEEGTLAHEFADLELRIQSHVGMDIQKKKWIDEKRLLKAHPLYMHVFFVNACPLYKVFK